MAELQQICLGNVRGPKGNPGNDGANGKSAYELAVEAGYQGNSAEWLASLKGPPGIQGPSPTAEQIRTAIASVVQQSYDEDSSDPVSAKAVASAIQNAMALKYGTPTVAGTETSVSFPGDVSLCRVGPVASLSFATFQNAVVGPWDASAWKRSVDNANGIDTIALLPAGFRPRTRQYAIGWIYAQNGETACKHIMAIFSITVTGNVAVFAGYDVTNKTSVTVPKIDNIRGINFGVTYLCDPDEIDQV